MRRISFLFLVIVCLLFTAGTSFAGETSWRYVGTGDCTGMDVGGLTVGSPMPDTGRCSSSSKGMTAVCWDGRSFKHYGSDKPQCTYKNVNAKSCKGGGSPGHMYECVETAGYVWMQVGSGDCTGRDVRPLSMGSAKPKPELCNAQFVNKTSVCWDGTSMKHWGSGQPQCTYKDIAPEACTGGGSPGYMYKCVYQTNDAASAVSARPQQDQTPYRAPAQPSQGWQQPMAASSVAGETSWRYVGTGDCTGMDVGGLTVGSPMPDTGRCSSSSKGMTAVCWDGRSFKHYGSDKPQCTYKNVNAKSCKGGGSPGHMYECVETAGYVWMQVGSGDCTGRDVRPLSMGSAKPKPELCNAQFVNKTSVCWDGTSMKHWGSGQPQCTYKDVAPEACTGGGSPGYMYKCVYQTMGASSQSFPDAGATAGESSSYQQGQPQQGFVERTVEEGVQIGVKKGMESLKGIFK